MRNLKVNGTVVKKVLVNGAFVPNVNANGTPVFGGLNIASGGNLVANIYTGVTNAYSGGVMPVYTYPGTYTTWNGGTRDSMVYTTDVDLTNYTKCRIHCYVSNNQAWATTYIGLTKNVNVTQVLDLPMNRMDYVVGERWLEQEFDISHLVGYYSLAWGSRSGGGANTAVTQVVYCTFE